MNITSKKHVDTTELYHFEVESKNGDTYTYYATITNDHEGEVSSTNVYVGEGVREPEDNEEIITKIEESLTTMY